jgi:hypothetical protein
MSEYMGMTVTIGGTLPASLIGEFLKVISDELSIESGPTTESKLRKETNRKKPIQWNAQSNYGQCNDLKAFCTEHGLSYIHTSAASVEYDGTLQYWIPGMEEEGLFSASQSGDPMIYLDNIRPLVNLLMEYAKKGDDALPLFITDKNEGVIEVVEKGLKNSKDFLPALSEKLQNILPEVPKLPPLIIKE